MKSVFSLDAVRGAVFGVAGAAIGMGITMLIRLAMGMAVWKAAPVSVIGCGFGTLFYLYGLGAFRYWLGRKPAPGEYPHHGWRKFLSFETNHKTIAIQYMLLSFLVIAIAAIYQLIARVDMARPGSLLLTPEQYTTLISLHGIMMLGAVLLGVSAMMNYLMPIMIGAKDMAFPKLNALSFWVTPPAVLFFLISLMTGGFDTGWTAYVPLSVVAPLGMQFMLLAFYLVGWSSILGSINFLTTIFKMRAPGMSLFRMPIFVWATMATAGLQLVFTQFIAMAFLMILLERLTGMTYFDASRGGSPLFFQHLFWSYSHPAVYIFVLPGLGVVSEIFPVFSRKPLFGYKAVALSSVGIAFGGVMVWGHHMFAADLQPILVVPFMFTTLLVAVPTGVKIFSWLATMWRGKIRLDTPMLFVLSVIPVFVVGGISGVVQGIVPADLYLTDSYFIVAHLHSTLFGGFVFPMSAAVFYWFPKVTGRFLSERLGKIQWAVLTAGFFITYMPMFWMGLNGMRRRVADYPPSFQLEQDFTSFGGFMIGLAFTLFFINIIRSLRHGKNASTNPWQSQTLEWQIASPPPEDNFAVAPQIVGSPYGYGIPGSRHAIMARAAARVQGGQMKRQVRG